MKPCKLRMDGGSKTKYSSKTLQWLIFTNLYKANPSTKGAFLTGDFPNLSANLQRDLCKDYTKEEVERALRSMGV